MSSNLHITLVYASAPRTVHEAVLDVAPGTTVLQALLQVRLVGPFSRNQ
jgi:hypothetical protein